MWLPKIFAEQSPWLPLSRYKIKFLIILQLLIKESVILCNRQVTQTKSMTITLTLFRMGLLRAAHRWWKQNVSPFPCLPKICYTCPTMMKLGTFIPYLKKIRKYMNHMTHPLCSAGISSFTPEVSKFCCIKKCRNILYFDA